MLRGLPDHITTPSSGKDVLGCASLGVVRVEVGVEDDLTEVGVEDNLTKTFRRSISFVLLGIESGKTCLAPLPVTCIPVPSTKMAPSD